MIRLGSAAAIGLQAISRIAQLVAVILVIATFNFVLVRAAPGDPAQVMAGQSGASDPKLLDDLRKEYGLDKPYFVQLVSHLGRVVRLDLGYSYRQRRPVVDLILERLPATLLLTVTAFCLALLIGTALGALAGLAAGSVLDTVFTVLSLVLYATPVFWLGLMLVLVFSVTLGWLPPFGYETINVQLSPIEHALDIMKHMIMPVISLAAIYLAIYARLMRSSIIEVAQQDFIKTARAKGLSERTVILKHAMRNALTPIITLGALELGTLLSGAVLTEQIFSIPGFGKLIVDAVFNRDYAVVQGVVLTTATIYITLNLIADIAYILVNPRLRG